jgi:hypothetical protein
MRSICLALVLVVIVLSSIVSNCQTQGSDQNVSRTDVRLFEPWNPHGLSIGIAAAEVPASALRSQLLLRRARMRGVAPLAMQSRIPATCR